MTSLADFHIPAHRRVPVVQRHLDRIVEDFGSVAEEILAWDVSPADVTEQLARVRQALAELEEAVEG